MAKKDQKIIREAEEPLFPEEFYKSLYGAARDALFVMDGEQFIDCNPQAAKLFGCTQEEIVGKTPFDFSPQKQPDGRSSRKMGQDYLEGAVGGKPQLFEWQHKRLDGTLFMAEVGLTAIPIEEKIYILAAVRDIADRQRAQAQIRKERDRAALYLDIASVIILALDREGKIALINRQGCDTLGYREEELVGKDWFATCIPVSIRDEMRDVFLKILDLESSPIKSYINAVITKEGRERMIAWQNQIVTSEDGNILGTLSSGEDVTERVQAEEAREQTMKRLETMHAIDLAILESDSFLEIARSVVKHLHEIVPSEQAVIALVENLDPLKFQILATSPELPPIKEGMGFEIPTSESLLLNNLASRESVVFPDIREINTPNYFFNMLKRAGIRTTAFFTILGSGTVVGALGLGSREIGAFSSDQIASVEEIASTLSVALQNAELLDDVRTQTKELRKMAIRITEMQELERKAIADELHDQVGQNLTAMSIHLNVVRNLLNHEDEEVASRLNEIQVFLEQTTQDIRDVMSELRPSVLDDYGFVAALSWYAEKTERLAEIEIDLQIQSKDILLPDPIATALFRISQEAVTNILRYANANRILIQYEETEASVGLLIQDNGKGFNLEDVGPGLGIKLMGERALAIGASFEIESTLDKGTKVRVAIGLNDEED